MAVVDGHTSVGDMAAGKGGYEVGGGGGDKCKCGRGRGGDAKDEK